MLEIIRKLLLNRYVQLLLVSIVVFIFAFNTGYQYKADKVEIAKAKEYKVLVEKLDKVYDFSVEKSNETRSILDLSGKKIDLIVQKVQKKQVPLTSVPCVPSEEFSSKWSEMNNAIIN